ncbi:MAG: hypothetical protein APR53_00955 [Methanoculleus sp. SDB]|nr:MAG: hypothetical protein APR53_00955 [Methanoculleus sp. SDB]
MDTARRSGAAGCRRLPENRRPWARAHSQRGTGSGRAGGGRTLPGTSIARDMSGVEIPGFVFDGACTDPAFGIVEAACLPAFLWGTYSFLHRTPECRVSARGRHHAPSVIPGGDNPLENSAVIIHAL